MTYILQNGTSSKTFKMKKEYYSEIQYDLALAMLQELDAAIMWLRPQYRLVIDHFRDPAGRRNCGIKFLSADESMFSIALVTQQYIEKNVLLIHARLEFLGPDPVVMASFAMGQEQCRYKATTSGLSKESTEYSWEYVLAEFNGRVRDIINDRIEPPKVIS